MGLLFFILSFILLTIVSSFFIISFYELTRHYVVIQPDGEEKKEGYILKWWSVWFEKVKRVNLLYYKGDSLKYKLSELNRAFPEIGNKILPQIFPDETSLTIKGEITDKEQSMILAALLCKIKINIHEGKSFLFLYIEEPVYYVPDLLRKPLSSCVVCMASVFGSIIWVSVNHLYDVFEWTNHKYFGFYFFWVIFIAVLSKLNKYLYSKMF